MSFVGSVYGKECMPTCVCVCTHACMYVCVAKRKRNEEINGKRRKGTWYSSESLVFLQDLSHMDTDPANEGSRNKQREK